MRPQKKRLLITGGTGLLALNWACALRDNWDVTLGTHRHSVDLAGVGSCPLVLEDPVRLQAQIEELTPDLVVHTAGLTSVDKCELIPQLAHQANVEIARNVALASAKHGVALAHVSTDHLFSGSQSMCAETQPPAPVNHYGRTKALAEAVVMHANPAALVLRTNFFGWGHAGRQSFTDWLIINLRAGNELSLFDNVFFTPILADSLALAAHQLVEMGVSGVFNLVGDQRLSKYEFARMLAHHFSLPQHLLLQHSFDGSELMAARPHDMSLDNRKAREILGRDLGDVTQFLGVLHHQEASGRAGELLKSVKPKQE
jgi:dTDP-4-dehydrorhamnose reductase